ncbi:MAG: NUDIX hydrolase [Clostridia bacterium]|nr:NUDIX hydrolase [Clostridia bacterium]
MKFEEKTEKINYVFRGNLLTVRQDDVILPNGKPAKREIIEHSGGAGIYCEKDGKILLVNQFRYPYKENVWEIPAGKINKGEDPKETAIRELSEEGGVEAEEITLLFKVYPTPGYTQEITYIYKADKIKSSTMHLDEDEFLSAQWIEKDQVKKMIENGEIKDAKTLIALLHELK